MAPGSHPNLLARRAFTLLEVLVVISIIAILLVVMIPAVNSVSKSNGRKAATGSLIGAIEQARMQAVKDGQPTYVVFPDQLPAGADTNAIQRYAYRAYGIFEDDGTGSGTVKQITPWRTLPTGVSFRSASLSQLVNTTSFPFTPLGTTAKASFPSLKFTSNGEIDPTTTPNATTGTIQFKVFEGSVNAGTDQDTNASHISDIIEVSRLTGRAAPVVANTPST